MTERACRLHHDQQCEVGRPPGESYTVYGCDCAVREIAALRATCEEQARVIARLEEALQEISKGKGRFSDDQFEHCRNTVEDMKALAVAALSPTKEA